MIPGFENYSRIEQIVFIVLCIAIILTAVMANAQPWCRDPYCGPVDPQFGIRDPFGYRRGPAGDYIDRCFNCQGPMQPRFGPPYPEYRGWRGNNYPWVGRPPWRY